MLEIIIGQRPSYDHLFYFNYKYKMWRYLHSFLLSYLCDRQVRQFSIQKTTTLRTICPDQYWIIFEPKIVWHTHWAHVIYVFCQILTTANYALTIGGRSIRLHVSRCLPLVRSEYEHRSADRRSPSTEEPNKANHNRSPRVFAAANVQ